MPLEELEKKLYRPEEPKRPLEPSYRKFRPVVEEPTHEEEKAAKEWLEETKKPPVFTPKQKKISKIFFIIFILLALGGGAAFYFLRQPFLTEQVVFTLTGPSEVRVGEKVVFTVNYKNNTPVVLSGAELVFSYPAGVVLIGGPAVEPGKSGAISYSLGNIGIGGEKKQEFPLRIIGEVDNTKQIEAKLVYRPENSSAKFENAAKANVTIAAHGLVLDLEAPQKVLDGEKVNYVIRYSNVSQGPFENVRIEAAYPENFYFESADPKPVIGSNVWLIDDVDADAGGQIFIKGILRGNEGENKTLKASIGIEENQTFIAFREAKASSQIASSPILIASSVNEVADYIAFPSDTLKYKITYKNNSNIGLREIVLKAQLSGAMLDFSGLSNPTGSFDGRTGTITWSAGNVPEFLVLNPGEGGELTFSVKLKGNYPIATFTDKNFTVKMAATIETRSTGLFLAQEKISQTSEITTKIGGRLSVRSKAYFNDQTAPIANTGPLPPRVNQTTTYTIHWQVVNFSNDSENVTVKTALPPGVNWTGKVFNLRSETSPEYNERTGEVTWDIGKVQPGIGVILPAQEVVFQISLTPTLTQAGRIVPIFNPTTISGKDEFTGVSLSETTIPIPSDLPDDPTVGYDQGTVLQ